MLQTFRPVGTRKELVRWQEGERTGGRRPIRKKRRGYIQSWGKGGVAHGSSHGIGVAARELDAALLLKKSPFGIGRVLSHAGGAVGGADALQILVHREVGGFALLHVNHLLLSKH